MRLSMAVASYEALQDRSASLSTSRGKQNTARSTWLAGSLRGTGYFAESGDADDHVGEYKLTR